MNESSPKNESKKPGTIENPIVDSKLTREEALRPNPDFYLEPEVFERQIILPIKYFSVDGKYHSGQLIVDKDIEKDVTDFFLFLLEKKFSINKIVPIADKKYDFDDMLSMLDNNTSGFCPRNIEGTDRPSNHAHGLAFDVNPLFCPEIKDGKTKPEGAIYDPSRPGTLTPEIVDFLLKKPKLKKPNWRWGGDYVSSKDYQHLEYLINKNK
jgi:hypothetical protein